MDKSAGIKKSVIQMRRKIKVLLGILILSSILTLFAHLEVFAVEIGNFHIIAEDLNLLDLESLLKEYFPKMQCKGDISLEADLKFEESFETVVDGDFSSDELSLSGENLYSAFDLSKVEGEFKIKLKERIPEVTGRIRSAGVRWGRLSAQDLEADYILYGNKLDINNCKIKFTDGTAHINGSVDFSKSPPVFDIKLITQGVDIGTISEKLGYSKPVSGRLSCDGNLSGEWGDPTTFLGKAKIKIEDGDLGKMGLIGRLITFSPLATISKDIPLNNMEGDFLISEGYASTEDTILTGSGMKITAEGNVGWNKKLDFILNFYASSESLKNTPITKILGAIVDSFGNVLRRVKLTGTTDNPAFTIVPLGIAGTIVEGIEKSFNRDSPQANTPQSP